MGGKLFYVCVDRGSFVSREKGRPHFIIFYFAIFGSLPNAYTHNTPGLIPSPILGRLADRDK